MPQRSVPGSRDGQRVEKPSSQVSGRFGRVEVRRRMRDYVRGLLGPDGHKNSWQLAEYADHNGLHGLQYLLSRSRWDRDELRDDVQEYVAQRLGTPDHVLIADDTGFPKKGVVSAGVQRQYSGTAGGLYFNYCSLSGCWRDNEV